VTALTDAEVFAAIAYLDSYSDYREYLPESTTVRAMRTTLTAQANREQASGMLWIFVSIFVIGAFVLVWILDT
jgi:hypothetical protein